MGEEVDFLPADKHKCFLQDDSSPLGVHNQLWTKYSKQQVVISLQYLKENVKDEVNLYLPRNIKGFFKLILPF